jgi:hypothetical protein
MGDKPFMVWGNHLGSLMCSDLRILREKQVKSSEAECTERGKVSPLEQLNSDEQ